jgi:prevent-host-death family protein
MQTATIFEAKTNLSDLLQKARKGEPIIITSGREKVPVAKIEALQPVRKKRLGVMETPGFALTQAFFDPLPEDEQRFWNGEGA